ncbi:MAG TPA: glycosyltransferase [Thermoanaerobaculia bacterium]|jgi:glycosyltransferase involved in cell wall biosynthesis|nr:glycosyltransferase [Thermoanaerobaculia bacterium]
MRILRIIARLNVGGPAKHVVWLHEGLAKLGHECLLVTGTVPAGEQDMTLFATDHGVKPVVIPTMSRELSPADAVTIWRLWRLMREFRPDVVHTHTAKAGAVGRIAGLFYRRAKFVHTYHGHVFHSYYGRWKTRFFLAVERILARINTDRIVVLSEQQLHEIRDDFHVGSAEQFRIVPLGIDLQDLGGAGPAESRPHTQLVVGIVGRIAAIKNHDMFLRVAARLRGRARFVVYGDGADRAAMEQRAGNVEFAGTVEPRDIYNSLDIVALTSRNEGTPLALIEAMACGKPVIATAVGGVVDLLGEVVERRDGFEIRERGITAAPDDDAGFASGLTLLLDDATLRRTLSERGISFVENGYSKERLVADILSLYSEILS